MKYEAIENFSGIISMAKGQVREISNEALAKDLMKAKLIKKYIPTNEKSLKDELASANLIINELTEENKNLKEKLEELSVTDKENSEENTTESTERPEEILSENEEKCNTPPDNNKNKK